MKNKQDCSIGRLRIRKIHITTDNVNYSMNECGERKGGVSETVWSLGVLPECWHLTQQTVSKWKERRTFSITKVPPSLLQLLLLLFRHNIPSLRWHIVWSLPNMLLE